MYNQWVRDNIVQHEKAGRFEKKNKQSVLGAMPNRVITGQVITEKVQKNMRIKTIKTA